MNEKMHVDCNDKPVLIIADYRGWAWDIKARNLKRIFESMNMRTEIKYYYDYFKDIKTGWHDIGYSPLKRIEFGNYLFIILFSINMIPIINETFSFKNAYVGICSHESYNGKPYDFESIKIFNLFKGVFVLNKLLYSEFDSVIENLYYCPNGVDTSWFVPRNVVRLQNKINIGWVGDPEHSCQKGFYEIVEPMKQYSEFNVLVANKKEHYFSYEKMVNFYNSIDLLVCASDREGTPNPCLEAASCGRPIISTPVGNMPEFISDGYNGFFIDRNLKSLHKALSIFINNKELLITLGNNARKTAKEWDWSIQAKKFVDMMRRD